MHLRFLSALALAAGLAAPAAAQNYQAAPANGTEALRPGVAFATDFSLPPGASEGESENEAGCPGVFTLDRPDVNLRVEGSARPLRLYVRSGSDTVLMVRTPAGEWLCNDDTDGTNPALALDPAQPGLYHVWVGLFFGNDVASEVSLFAAEHDAAAAGVDPALPAVAGGATLGGGFQPDPREIAVTVGSEVTVAEQGCAGFVSAAPTYNLNYTGDGARPLFIFARPEGEDEDLTLAVNLPDGTWACNDDAEGLNPGLRFERPMAGLYGIWVGSFRSRARTEAPGGATLFLSETDGPDPGAMMMDDHGMFEGDFEGDFPEGYSGGEDLMRDAAPSSGTLAFSGGSAAALDVRAGGPSPNSVEGFGCAGYLDPAAPTAVVDFTGTGPLALWVDSAADATLVVGLPDGGWTCNDDYDGLMPGVVVEGAAAGRYPVWVGTFLDGEPVPATLHVGSAPFGE